MRKSSSSSKIPSLGGSESPFGTKPAMGRSPSTGSLFGAKPQALPPLGASPGGEGYGPGAAESSTAAAGRLSGFAKTSGSFFGKSPGGGLGAGVPAWYKDGLASKESRDVQAETPLGGGEAKGLMSSTGGIPSWYAQGMKAAAQKELSAPAPSTPANTPVKTPSKAEKEKAEKAKASPAAASSTTPARSSKGFSAKLDKAAASPAKSEKVSIADSGQKAVGSRPAKLASLEKQQPSPAAAKSATSGTTPAKQRAAEDTKGSGGPKRAAAETKKASSAPRDDPGNQGGAVGEDVDGDDDEDGEDDYYDDIHYQQREYPEGMEDDDYPEQANFGFTPLRDLEPAEKEPEVPKGPPPLTDDEQDFMKACVGALDHGELERLLKQYGPAIIDSPGGGGVCSTGILYAAQRGDVEGCRLLVKYGGERALAVGDFKGRTAIHYAEKAGHAETLKEVLKVPTTAVQETPAAPASAAKATPWVP